MTINTTGNRVSYAGNGTTTAFSFPYFFFASGDLVVLRVASDGSSTTLALNTDYTVSGAGAAEGGTVTLTTAPAVGQTLVVYRDPAPTQTTDYVDNDPLPAAAISRPLDKLTTLVQRLIDRVDRTFGLSDSDTSGASLTIPTPSANQVLGWNNDGTALKNFAPVDNTLLALDLANTTDATKGVALVANALDKRDLASASDAAKGAALVGFSQSGTGAAARTVAAELRETIKLSQYIAVGDATVDLAFSRALAAFTRPGTLEIPQGFFNLSGKVQIRTDIPIKIRGAGMNSTIIACTAGTLIDTMFEQTGAISDTFEMSDLTLLGSGKAGSGYKSEQVIASLFRNLAITGTTSVAIRTNNGYSNTFENVKLYSNTGGGLQCTGVNNNNINVLRSQIYANSGIGIEIGNGYSVNIIGCDIETNAVAGGMFYDIKQLNVQNNYLERNGGTGYAYTSPENITVKADLHILSSGKIITLVRASDVEQCVIQGNQFTPYGTGNTPSAGLSIDSPIFCTVADGLKVTNNEVLDTTKIKQLVSFYNNNTKSAAFATVIDQNTVNSIGFLGTANTSFAFNTMHNVDSPLAQSPHNYASQDLFDYLALSGSTGYLRRSANDYQDYPVYALGVGDLQFGYDIDLTKHPELKGKTVYFGVWYHVDDTGATIQLSLGGNTDTDGTVTDSAMAAGVYVFKSVCKQVALTDTTLYIAVKRVGSGTQPVLFTNPIAAVAGFGLNRYPFPNVKPEWKRNTAPVDGTWQQRERVVAKVPAVGSPKAYVCTVAGTPGTWVSEGNL